MNMRHPAELPFFFGADAGLFGMYHAPSLPPRRAVLMCAPLGHDLIRCHRIYRQLAQALVSQGLAVLRFDYHGTGDAAGTSGEVDWERCVGDAITAADELRSRARVDRVAAFGVRLGGSVALTAAGPARFDEVVVWDPVLDGGDYVASLDAMQAALREDSDRFARPRTYADVDGQWLGFAIGDRLRHQLCDLRVGPAGVPTRVVDTLDDGDVSRWASIVPTAGAVEKLAPPTPWHDLRRLESAVLSAPLIRAVAGHLKEVA